jgi:hypothetical protein
MGHVLERAAHLIRRVRYPVVQPPREQAQQRADHVLDHYFGRHRWLQTSLRDDILEMLAQQSSQFFMRAPENHAAAPLSYQRPIETTMTGSVLEEDPRELGPLGWWMSTGPSKRRQLLSQRVPQFLEAADEQIVLVVKVRIEGGAADVGTVQHVLDRDVDLKTSRPCVA